MELALQKFEEWTKGKDPRAARVKIFEEIRDIPYAVIPQALDSERGPDEMLRVNKGSCQPKHYLLGEMFARLGISVFYMVYQFRWDDLPIDYPRYLKKLAQRMPNSRHIACRVRIDDNLVLVDATCDLPLEQVGIPVNKDWDGFSDLMLPFIPLDDGEIYHSSEKGYLEPPSFSSAETEFYAELNRLLDEIRVKA